MKKSEKITIKKEIFDQLVHVQGRLQIVKNKEMSLDDVLRYLLDRSKKSYEN